MARLQVRLLPERLLGGREARGRLYELRGRGCEIATQRKRIGMIFPRFNLFAHTTAVEAPVQVRDEDRASAAAAGASCSRESGLRTNATRTRSTSRAAPVEAGPPEQVLGRPEHERTKAFLSKVLA